MPLLSIIACGKSKFECISSSLLIRPKWVPRLVPRLFVFFSSAEEGTRWKRTNWNRYLLTVEDFSLPQNATINGVNAASVFFSVIFNDGYEIFFSTLPIDGWRSIRSAANLTGACIQSRISASRSRKRSIWKFYYCFMQTVPIRMND